MNESANKIKSSGAAGHFGDRAFKWLTLAMALTIFVLVLLIGFELFKGSKLSLEKFGWHFLVSSDWDPVNDVYGALPFIFGTVVSSLIALIIAVPISIATAVYLTELAPQWLRQPLTMFIELLAAVPSVILGLWGIFVMVPVSAGLLVSAAAKKPGVPSIFQGSDLRCQHTGRRDHCGDHDHPHHHVRVAGDFALRSRPPARGRLRAWGHALGSHAHRRFELRQKRIVRRGDSWTWPGAG